MEIRETVKTWQNIVDVQMMVYKTFSRRSSVGGIDHYSQVIRLRKVLVDFKFAYYFTRSQKSQLNNNTDNESVYFDLTYQLTVLQASSTCLMIHYLTKYTHTICMNPHIQIYVCVFVYVCRYVYIYTCLYIYIYHSFFIHSTYIEFHQKI